MIVWATWLNKAFPGYENASGAIINSIGCLTAFVPQASPFLFYPITKSHLSIYQGLPVCVALSLTIVAKRMAKHHVLVKNLATIETLGCMSVLCSDKTGTLTMGQMVTLIIYVHISPHLSSTVCPRNSLPRPTLHHRSHSRKLLCRRLSPCSYGDQISPHGRSPLQRSSL